MLEGVSATRRWHWARRPVGAVKKSRALRDGRYPVFRQFKAGLGLVQREPWPPGAPNPWRYKRQSAIDPRFSMYEALGAALLTGGVGINFVPLPPLVPRSLCALGASLFFMSLVVVRDARATRRGVWRRASSLPYGSCWPPPRSSSSCRRPRRPGASARCGSAPSTRSWACRGRWAGSSPGPRRRRRPRPRRPRPRRRAVGIDGHHHLNNNSRPGRRTRRATGPPGRRGAGRGAVADIAVKKASALLFAPPNRRMSARLRRPTACSASNTRKTRRHRDAASAPPCAAKS